MKNPLRMAACFGVTSGIITTLGLMVGLDAGTNSKLAVIGGILTIAIADAFSDTLSIYVSEESENVTNKEIWKSSLTEFFVKFFVTLSFAVPVLLFSLRNAVEVGIVWGFLLLGALSVYIAEERKEKVWKVVAEHLIIMSVVIVITYLAGKLIAATFF